MLKFLDNRTHEKPAKSPIKFKPEMIYGISVESPHNFQSPFTIVHQNTYVNPYLEFEGAREKSLSKDKTRSLRPSWTWKTNLQMVEEQKIVSSQTEDIKRSPESRYKQSYYQQYTEAPNRFRITRGEFTNFIEKNNHYKSIGPLHGQERTNSRIEETKKSVWLKPDVTCSSGLSKKNSMMYSTYFEHMRQSSDSNTQNLSRNNSLMSRNSKLITEKIRIRDNRDRLNSSFKDSLEKRKKTPGYRFELPKLQSDLVVGYRPDKIQVAELQDPMEQLRGLDEFELKLKKKFR